MADSRIIHRHGSAADREQRIVLHDGERAPEFEIGAEAECIKAYFDGETLFLSSGALGGPAYVNRVPLASEWTPVLCPSVIEIGVARFLYELERGERSRPAARWGDHTIVGTISRQIGHAVPAAVALRDGSGGADGAPSCAGAPSASAPAPASGGFDASGFGAVTVVGPAPNAAALNALAERLQAARAGVVPSVRGALAPDADNAERSADPPPADQAREPDNAAPAVSHEAKLATVAPPNLLAQLGERARDDFRRTPRSTRLVLMALPFIAWATLTYARPEAAPELRASVEREQKSIERQRPAASSERAPANKPAPVVSSSTQASSSQRATLPARVRPGSGKLKRTLEARAADAAARGARAEAARLYDELAREYPERHEFATAARILSGEPRMLQVPGSSL